jgi:Skp family chaperone for outer membrane proteins
MLSATELKSLGNLATKAAPTDSDKAQIQALLAKSKKDSDDLSALQQKKESDLTDSDKLRLSTLTAQGQAGQQSLSDINQDYRNQLDQKSSELNAQINSHMKDVISQIAAKQGITVVFDSTVAVYASLDITKDVLAILNK